MSRGLRDSDVLAKGSPVTVTKRVNIRSIAASLVILGHRNELRVSGGFLGSLRRENVARTLDPTGRGGKENNEGDVADTLVGLADARHWANVTHCRRGLADDSRGCSPDKGKQGTHPWSVGTVESGVVVVVEGVARKRSNPRRGIGRMLGGAGGAGVARQGGKQRLGIQWLVDRWHGTHARRYCRDVSHYRGRPIEYITNM